MSDTEELNLSYKPEEGRDPKPGNFVRVVEGAVVEGPVGLADDPEVFFPPDLEGEWIRLKSRQKVECHWILQEDGSFKAPPPLEPPADKDPLNQLRTLLRDNPDVLERLQELKDK